jgi:excisionase family DNA binding protein
MNAIKNALHRDNSSLVQHRMNIKETKDMTKKYSTYDELPVTISADEVAMVLGISRANAYSLMHTKGFPTIFLGRRMIVPKDKFIEWIEQQVAVG